MAQGGYIGHGVRIGYATGSPQTWRELEQVQEVTIPGLTSDKIDTTVHGTPGRLKRNIAGEQEVSDMEFTLMRDADPSTSPYQNQLFAYNNSSTSLYWRVEIPTTSNPADNLYEAYEFTGRLGMHVIDAPRPELVVLNGSVIFDGTFFNHFNPGASEF